MSCILPVVRNKKIVDYRIQQKDARWKSVGVDKKRLGNIVDRDLEKIRDKLNNSTRT